MVTSGRELPPSMREARPNRIALPGKDKRATTPAHPLRRAELRGPSRTRRGAGSFARFVPTVLIAHMSVSAAISFFSGIQFSRFITWDAVHARRGSARISA
jgi:hypothetical protein